ncbi:protein pelota [Nematocida major]|uniref:protein pelota n=1 Tax=Nematocida major TaxID=1912982 RepID=UPI002007E073|nr:protein pelota [Nematocida major]KAH9386943.1 protein pelota [Nematocida major]
MQTKWSVFLDVLPEDVDDIYEMYRIIEENDRVKTVTHRSVVEGKSKTRVTLLLEVEVEKVSVDLAAGILFVKGKILTETEHTKVGSFHTLEVPVHQRVSLTKEHISSASLKVLEGLTIENKATISYLICRKEGYSFLLGTEYTLRRVGLPEKVKSREKLFQQVLSHLKGNITAFVIVSPEKEAEEFFRRQKDLKDRVVFIKKAVNSPNTHRGDTAEIEGIYKSPDLLRKLKGVRKGNDLLALNSFYRLEETSTKGIAVGVKEVKCACENYLAKTLILSDGLIKSDLPEERKEAEEIMKLARQGNSEVCIISQYTMEGERLKERGGAVAILTQPVDISSLF